MKRLRLFDLTRMFSDIPINGATDVKARVKNLNGLFPWRASADTSWERPSIYSKWMLSKVQKNIGRSLLDLADVVPANTAAFQAATEGIFTHTLMMHHRTYVTAKHPGSAASRGQELDGELPPKLPDLFAPELAEFYRYAIEQHCQNHTHVCTYSLKSVKRVTLTEIQLYAGELHTTDMLALPASWGTFIFVERSSFDGGLDVAALKKIYDDSKNSRVMFRLCVEIECEGSTLQRLCYTSTMMFVRSPCSCCCYCTGTEVFAITDVESNAVVQGDLNPRIATHKVLYLILLCF